MIPIVPLSENEDDRLQALYQYQILDTEPEQAFDDLVVLAATICNAPIAFISLVDAHRQWFKAKIGLEISETPLDIAFCKYTILQATTLIIPDALDDDRFAHNPAVVGAPYVRFYASTPLISPDGYAVGTLCVVDQAPRELTHVQIEALQALGRQVVSQLELRQKLIASERLRHETRTREITLLESEKRFRTMADSAPVLIWMDDSDKQAIFHNQTWHQFTGRSPEQQLGHGWTKSLHPHDRERWEVEYDLAFKAQQPYTMEYRLKRADGEYRWMLETGVPRFHPDGTFAGFTGSCVDITERKSFEQDNQLLREVTHAIINSADFHSALAIALEKVCEATHWEFGEAWVPSIDNAVMECSPAWYSKRDRFAQFRQQSEHYTFASGFGIPGRVWLSKKPEWHQDISAAAGTIYPRVQLVLEAGLKATLGIPLLANDEVISVLVFYMSEARKEDQRLIDLITASTELGLFVQRKQAEEEVRKMLAKEQELNQFKSDFIANISHELRTPLTSVLGLSNILIQQHYGALNPKQTQYLSLIHSSGEHLLNLINDLLDLAKIEAGKQELFKDVISVAELCQTAIEMVEVKAMAKNVTVHLELPVAIDTILVDDQRILQILLNFLSNAVKFTPNGGQVTLTTRLGSGAECREKALPVNGPTQSEVEPNAQFLVIEVNDTGIGVPLEKQHLLFRTFQQIDAEDHQFKGSGLGLTVAKYWAELHDGFVSFTSTTGVGSTFSVWLPI